MFLVDAVSASWISPVGGNGWLASRVAHQPTGKNDPPQPVVQDNTDNNIQDLKNQLAAERRKEAEQAALAPGNIARPIPGTWYPLRNEPPHNLDETAKQSREERPRPGNLPIGFLNLSRAHRNWLNQI